MEDVTRQAQSLNCIAKVFLFVGFTERLVVYVFWSTKAYLGASEWEGLEIQLTLVWQAGKLECVSTFSVLPFSLGKPDQSCTGLFTYLFVLPIPWKQGSGCCTTINKNTIVSQILKYNKNPDDNFETENCLKQMTILLLSCGWGGECQGDGRCCWPQLNARWNISVFQAL